MKNLVFSLIVAVTFASCASVSGNGNVREEKSGCEWRFITAKSRAELAPILAAYDQTVDKRPNESDPQGPL